MISREEVGLIPGRPNSTEFENVDRIAGHYFGGDYYFKDEGAVFKVYRQIQYQDMYPKNYTDIMYSLGLTPFRPDFCILRGLDVRGAANGGSTTNKIAPSVLVPIGPAISGVKHIPNWEQNLLDGARKADDYIEQWFGKQLPWCGHKDLRPTGCPGDWFYSQIQAQFDERPPANPISVWVPDPDYSQRPIVGLKKYGGVVQWDGFVDFGYVRWVQMFLNRTSPEGCAQDGVWGPQSDDRLRKFQGYFAQQGFPCHTNGITDYDTWATIHWIATVEGIV